MSIHVQPITPQEFCQLAPVAVDLYISAMGYPPIVRERRIETWIRDSQQRGFYAVCAHDGTYLHGIAYGFRSCKTHWWTRIITQGLVEREQMGAREQEITKDFFELAEIHVSPRSQGSGIGRRLLTELVSLTDAPFVVLSTPEVPGEDNGAFKLYRSLGFEDLLRDFIFPGDTRPFAILVCPSALLSPAEQS